MNISIDRQTKINIKHKDKTLFALYFDDEGGSYSLTVLQEPDAESLQFVGETIYNLTPNLEIEIK